MNETRRIKDEIGIWHFYQCSVCYKTYRNWKSASNHIIRKHDGCAVIDEVRKNRAIIVNGQRLFQPLVFLRGFELK